MSVEVKSPEAWLEAVAKAIDCESTTSAVANKLDKEGVSAGSVTDYAAVFYGTKILNRDLKEVQDIVKRDRKSLSTSAVNTALKGLGIPESLLVPVGRRGRQGMDLSAIANLFAEQNEDDSEGSEDSDS